MPIYEFKCKNCGKINEFIELNLNEKNLKCNFCGSGELIKLFSNPSILSNIKNSGKTCCGRDERCISPPCGDDGKCKR